MKSIRAVVAVVVALGLAPTVAQTQEPAGLAFVGGIGYRTGGPGPALVDGLVAAGLDGTRYQQCIGCASEYVDYPFYFNEGLELSGFVGARYYFGVPLTAELLISNGPRGHAEGFDNDTRDHLLVRYASFLLTGALSTHLGPLGIEAGPAVSFTSWDTTINSQEAGHANTMTVGTHAALFGRFYVGDVLLTVRTGKRWIPSADVRRLEFDSETDYQASYVSVTVSPWISF